MAGKKRSTTVNARVNGTKSGKSTKAVGGKAKTTNSTRASPAVKSKPAGTKRKAAKTSTSAPARKIQKDTVSQPLVMARPTGWGDIPTVPLEMILSNLHSAGDNCKDLVAFRSVNYRFKREVDEFLRRSNIRPTEYNLKIAKERMAGKSWILTEVSFSSEHTPFHKLFGVDWEITYPILSSVWTGTALTRSQDKKVTTISHRAQAINSMDMSKARETFLGNTHFHNVDIEDMDTAKEWSLTVEILRTITAHKVSFCSDENLNDTIANNIIEIASICSAQTLKIKVDRTSLTDPNSFVRQLDSLVAKGVSLSEEHMNAFGLSEVFLAQFLQEKINLPGWSVHLDGDVCTVLHPGILHYSMSIEWREDTVV